MATNAQQTAPLSDRSAFQRDLLAVLGHMGSAYGLAVKHEMQDRWGEEINHGRLYPNLDQLVDAGLVNKEEVDGRTNSYELTERGREFVSEDAIWRVSAVGGSE